MRKNAPTQQWQAGYAECDITPPIGHPMSGYARPDRAARGIIAPLIAQALALRDADGQTALVFTADILGLDRTSVDYLRHAINQRFGLPSEAVLLGATHTHWGPAIHYRLNFLGGGPGVWYLQELEAKLLSIAAEALQNLSPTTLEYSALDTRIGHNRRLPAADGSMSWGVNQDASYDTHTPLLSVNWTSKGDKSPRRVLLLSHACHPTSTGFTPRWSPDYPGALRDRVREQTGDTQSMFIMGCGADAKVTHTDRRSGELIFSAGPAQARAAGRKLANAVLGKLAKGDAEKLAPTLICNSESGKFSFAKLRSENELRALFYDEKAESIDREWARQVLAYPDNRRAYDYEMTLWKLGDALTFFALPDEVCSPLAPRTRAEATTPHAMTAAYTNGVQAYIPSSQIVREGGYEGESSHRAWFLPATFTECIDKEWDNLVRRAIAGLNAKHN